MKRMLFRKFYRAEIIISLRVLGTIIVPTEFCRRYRKYLLKTTGKLTSWCRSGESFSDISTEMAASKLTFPEMVTTPSRMAASQTQHFQVPKIGTTRASHMNNSLRAWEAV